ncbi:hypothetical protein [Lentzea tibetensis]|uniref:hypothetical protein n=1 Tax=Lentzea tibetensis TaxID=2591470 RepID=UPI001C9A0A1F|nr:hypothetical protein [Lentzea tibetensis]
MDSWSGNCLAGADRRAAKFLGLALACGVVVMVIGVPWIAVVSVPVIIELAAPGLRHLIARRKVRRLMSAREWRPVDVHFVPGRRIGRSAYLEMDGSDRSYLRLPEMPERVRVLVRHSRRVWLAGPDDRGRAVVITSGRPFLTLGRIVVR